MIGAFCAFCGPGKICAFQAHAQHVFHIGDVCMLRNFFESVWLNLQVHRPPYVIEGLPDAAAAVREEDAGAVIVKDEREIGREPLALREHARREIAERVHAPARIAPKKPADLIFVGKARHERAAPSPPSQY
jgi:hypothetical protein